MIRGLLLFVAILCATACCRPDPQPPVFVKVPVPVKGAQIILPPKPMLPLGGLKTAKTEEERDRIYLATMEVLVKWNLILEDLIQKHNKSVDPEAK